MKDARIGDLAFNRADRSLWGIRHLNGLCDAGAHRAAVHAMEAGAHVPLRHGRLRPRRLARRHALVASFGEINGRQDVRVLRVGGLLAGDVDAGRRSSTSAPSVPTTSSSRPTAGTSTAAPTTPASRTSSGTSSRPEARGGDQRRDRLLPARSRSAATTLIVFRYTGQGFVPTRIAARPLEDVSPITFLGERSSRSTRSSKPWNVGSPASDPLRRDARRRRACTAWRRSAPRVVLSRSCRATRTRRPSAARSNLSDPLQLNRAQPHRVVLARHGDLPASERAAPARATTSATTGAASGAERRRLLRPVRADEARPQGLLRGRSGHKTSLVYDEPRQLDLDLSGTSPATSTACPSTRTWRWTSTSSIGRSATLSFTDVRNSLGDVDDEKGTRWSATCAGAGASTARRARGSAATYDRGLAAAASGHSSVWFRSAAGFSPRDRERAVRELLLRRLRQQLRRPRRREALPRVRGFPGAASNEIGGRNFVKSTIEWNLPPWRFRRAGTPGFYATWLRPAVFVGGPRHQPRRTRRRGAPRRTSARSSTLRFTCCRR